MGMWQNHLAPPRLAVSTSGPPVIQKPTTDGDLGHFDASATINPDGLVNVTPFERSRVRGGRFAWLPTGS